MAVDDRQDLGIARMADEALRRLLNAEMEAERVVARADAERQAIVDQAKRDARAEEQQFADRIAELRANFRGQAEQRAQQKITAMQRRFREQTQALRASAKQNEEQALDDAVALLTGTKNP